MDLERVEHLPPDLVPHSLTGSESSLAQGYLDRQSGDRYIRLTCRHENQISFRITDLG